MSFLSWKNQQDRTAILSLSPDTLYLRVDLSAMNGVVEEEEERIGKIARGRRELGARKGVDYLQRNGVPGLLCTLSGRRIGGLRQFAFICGFLTTPPFHGSPSDQIRISRAAVSHLRRPNLAFFARDIISGSVTHCCQSRFVFSSPFFLFSLLFFFLFFLDDKEIDNWTRDLQPERSRTLERVFFSFLISDV